MATLVDPEVTIPAERLLPSTEAGDLLALAREIATEELAPDAASAPRGSA